MKKGTKKSSQSLAQEGSPRANSLVPVFELLIFQMPLMQCCSLTRRTSSVFAQTRKGGGRQARQWGSGEGEEASNKGRPVLGLTL